MRQIKVLVVDDSLMYSGMLEKGLNSDPAIDVVATASNPYDARDKILKYKPDVMTLDIEMPRMDGIEFLRKLMPQYPIPTVMVSSLSDKVFDALDAGAVDFVEKPRTTDRAKLDHFVREELPLKIKIASTAHMSAVKKKVSEGAGITLEPLKQDKDRLVVIGASTGGPEAVATVLSGFGPDIPGTVVVQHMPAGFTDMFAKRLNDQCRVRVKEACDGDVLQTGQVLIAPGGDRHTLLTLKGGRYQVECRNGPRVNGVCPSADVLFESAAKIAGANAIAIILTGMGGDGAKGMLAMRKAGAQTIGQDPSTCVVYGMPKVAYEAGAVMYQEKLGDISGRTYQILKNMQGRNNL